MNSTKLFVASISISILASCAIADTSERPRPPYGEPNDPSEEYLPFVMEFKIDGKPVLKRRDGTILEGKVIQPPITTTLIESFDTVSYIKYKGSCKMSFQFDGEIIEYTLPDSYCKQ